MNGKIASGVNGYIVQIVFKGSLRILGCFYIGATRMDFATYIDRATIDVYAMICVDGAMVILGGIVSFVTCSNRTGTRINTYSIQSNRFADITLKHSIPAAGLDIQTGVVQVGFLNKTDSRFTTYRSIIPSIIIAIADGQERSAVIRLTATAPARPFCITIDLLTIIILCVI